jgi:hypothetical protein
MASYAKQIVQITTDLSSSRKVKEDVMAFYIKEYNKQICMQVGSAFHSARATMPRAPPCRSAAVCAAKAEHRGYSACQSALCAPPAPSSPIAPFAAAALKLLG